MDDSKDLTKRDAGRPIEIALLTPYTGGNLGDAAIQEAVIANIRSRVPNPSLVHITLSPVTTSRLHGIPAVPIGSRTFPPQFDLPSSAERTLRDTARVDRRAAIDRLRTFATKSSWLSGSARTLRSLGGWVAYFTGARELYHVSTALRALRGSDMLIVAGGGQIDDYWGGAFQQPYALFKWAVLAKLVGAKLVFLSVGTCTLESGMSRFFVRHALRIAEYRSYRDCASKQLLNDLPFTHADQVYPDLAFGYPLAARRRQSRTREPTKVVAVSPIAYLSRYGWPKRDPATFRSYIASLTGFVTHLLDRGHKVVFFSSDQPDRGVIGDLISEVSRLKPDRVHQITNPDTNTLEQLFDELSGVDCVLASRLHGILLSHLMWKPVIAVSYDRKVDTHMESMKSAQYCLDLHAVRARSLIETFEELMSDADRVTSTLAEICAMKEVALKQQYDHLFGYRAIG